MRLWLTMWLMGCVCTSLADVQHPLALLGKVLADSAETIPFASVRLKGTSFKCTANELGRYQLRAPEGRYILQVSAIGYATHEQQVTLTHERKTLDVRLFPLQKQLDEVVVVAHSVECVNGSAYNAVAIGTTSPSLTWRRKPHPPEP